MNAAEFIGGPPGQSGGGGVGAGLLDRLDGLVCGDESGCRVGFLCWNEVISTSVDRADEEKFIADLLPSHEPLQPPKRPAHRIAEGVTWASPRMRPGRESTIVESRE